MAKKKEVKAVDNTPKQEGDIDPYAAGKHIKNPEPNNGGGRASRPAEVPTSAPGLDEPHTVPNDDVDELEEAVADEGRKGR